MTSMQYHGLRTHIHFSHAHLALFGAQATPSVIPRPRGSGQVFLLVPPPRCSIVVEDLA